MYISCSRPSVTRTVLGAWYINIVHDGFKGNYQYRYYSNNIIIFVRFTDNRLYATMIVDCFVLSFSRTDYDNIMMSKGACGRKSRVR